MDLRDVGLRIKETRETKGLTQEELAALVDLSPTHISVIERGQKVPKLDTFVAIANALDVSADSLLRDVVAQSVNGVVNNLSASIMKLPPKEQKRVIRAIEAYVQEYINFFLGNVKICAGIASNGGLRSPSFFVLS